MSSPGRIVGQFDHPAKPRRPAEAELIGLAALVVMVQILSPLAEHLNVMAHEGTHAITESIVGFGIKGIEINPIAEGGTSYHRPTLCSLYRRADAGLASLISVEFVGRLIRQDIPGEWCFRLVTEASRPPPTAVVSCGLACPRWSAVRRAR